MKASKLVHPIMRSFIVKSAPVTAALLALAGCGSSSSSSSSATSATASAQITWSASSGATGYYIEESSDGVTFAQIDTIAAPTTSLTVPNLSTGQLYYFRIRAYNGGGISPYSDMASVSL
jgi:hypothetical protein